MKNRIISLVLCVALVFQLVPLNTFAEEITIETDIWQNPGYAIGNVAVLNTYWSSYHITDNPSAYSDEYWDDDSYWIYNEELGVDEIPDDSIEFAVTNYYADTEREYLWYKVEAAPGFELPQKLKEKPYILHMVSIDDDLPSLEIGEGGKNYILDAEGSTITEAVLPFFETLQLESVSTLLGNVSYQWQVYAVENWLDILGEDESKIEITSGMLYSALEDNIATVRCVAKAGTRTVEGDSFVITVQDYEFPQPEEPEYAVIPPVLVDGEPVVASADEQKTENTTEGDENIAESDENIAEGDENIAEADENIAEGDENIAEADGGELLTEADVQQTEENVNDEQTFAGDNAQSESAESKQQVVADFALLQNSAEVQQSDKKDIADKADENDAAVLTEEAVQTEAAEAEYGIKAEQPVQTESETQTEGENLPEHNEQQTENHTAQGSAALQVYNDVVPLADDDYCYVTVKYVFTDGEDAANPYVMKFLKGEVLLDYPVPFPTVLGYLPYFDDVQQDELLINMTVNSDVVFNVVYKPTDVKYTIDIYFQNTHDNEYTFYRSQEFEGLTGSLVPHDPADFDGMYALLHTHPEIAANGSTRLEIYYNREYYMTIIDLDGGHGVYSTYARFGSDLASHIGTPVKPGYSFAGWDKLTPRLDENGKFDKEDGKIVYTDEGDGIAEPEGLPAVVPHNDMVYRAVWVENTVADVRVVFWGEDADWQEGVDDEEDKYAYINAELISAKPGDTITIDSLQYKCGLTEHIHDNNCVTGCGKEPHKHSADCYSCKKEEHAHIAKDCYNNVGNAADTPYGAPSNPKEGQIYRWGNRYIYIGGQWYRYNGTANNGTIIQPTCGKDAHTHGSGCAVICGKDEHTHEDSCYTKCVQHTHSNECTLEDLYNKNLWTVNTDKTNPVTVLPDGSTILNVYLDRTTFTLTFKNGNTTVATIEEKWGAKIFDRFDEAPFSTTYNGRAWQCTESSKYGFALQTLDIMPQFDATFNLYNKSTNILKTIYYYVQKPGTTVSENTWPTSTDNFELLKTVQTYFNYATYEEEYHDMVGYTRYEAQNSVFGSDEQANFSDNKLNLYYLTADYTLDFVSENKTINTENVKYQQSLKEFETYEPETYPPNLEKGAYEFDGWYVDQALQTPVRWDSTMKAENMVVYAKWNLVTHKVNIYLRKNTDGTFNENEKALQEEIDEVIHGHTVFGGNYEMETPEHPDKLNYKFLGWFYMDGDKELMWDFDHTVVTKDTDIYAKWSSEVLVPYKVRFVVDNGDGTYTEIADPISSSALAGQTLTFNAKGNNDLYEGYREGYFPLTTSHSLNMHEDMAESGVTYDFIYNKKPAVPYTVKYVDSDGNELKASKIVNDNTLAVVTEIYEKIDGYVPDAYKKTLIVDADDEEHNVIEFVYTKDETKGVYYYAHYIQNVDGTDEIIYMEDGGIDIIGTEISVPLLNLDGFTYSYSEVNGSAATPADNNVTGSITEDGLLIEIHYTRNKYPYKVVYRDTDTGATLLEDKVAAESEYAYYGSVITESNPPKIENYDFSSVTSVTVMVEENKENPAKNAIIVYYREKSVRIDYVVVAPGGGTVTPQHTDVKTVTGTGAGSLATPDENYRFVGWFEDQACTRLVTSNPQLVLDKPDGGWIMKTYYAKFEPATGLLTIDRAGSAADESQMFVYKVESVDEPDFVMYVTVQGNGQTTIGDIPIGNYTITQQNGWSWRYNDGSETVAKDDFVLVDGAFSATVGFDNDEHTKKWLNGNSEPKINKRSG